MASLDITSEPLEHRQVQLTIVVPDDRVEKAVHEIVQRYARRLRVPGYRPGRVPLRAITGQVSEEDIRKDAMELLTEQVVGEAIRARELHPVAPTEVERVSEAPLSYRAVVPLAPEVDLGDYKSLRVEEPEPAEVSEEDVDEVVEKWRQDMAYVAPVDREADEEDIVTVSLIGRHGDAVVFEEEEFNLPLNGEGAKAANLPPEIIEHLVGLVAGDTAEFEVKYSEFWPQPELQGENVSFEAEVAKVAAITLPELDDELAQQLGDIDSLDDLRQRVRDQAEIRSKLESRDAYVESALDALVEAATIDYPPALLQAQTAELVADLRTKVERQGFTWERWLELQKTDVDQLWDNLQTQAERRLKRGVVLEEFVRLEGVAVKDDDVDAEVNRLTEMLPKDVSKKSLPSVDQVRRSASSRMLTSRALEHLLEITSGQAAAASGTDEPEEAGSAASVSGDAEAPNEPDSEH